MVVIILYAFVVLAVFFAAWATWLGVTLHGKVNQVIEAILRLESALRLLTQKSL